MKIQLLFAILLLSSLNIKAQMAKGYKKGTIVLADSTFLSGYVKDNMANDASISMMTENTEKKTKYTGSDILSAEIDDKKFLCLKDDFFQIITSGDLTFLKKTSNASSKPVYNGTEAIFIKGSEGRQGDYFIYDSTLKQLLLVNKKNKERIISLFLNDAAALDVVKQNASDREIVKNAITLYNSRTSSK